MKSLSPALSAGALFLMSCFFRLATQSRVRGDGRRDDRADAISGIVIRKYSLIATKESVHLTGLVSQFLHARRNSAAATRRRPRRCASGDMRGCWLYSGQLDFWVLCVR